MPRASKANLDLKSLARTHTEAAVRTLTSVMTAAKAPPNARVTAAGILLDRGWGRAPVSIEGPDGGDIRVVIRQIIETVGESVAEEDAKLIEHEDSKD